MTGAKRRKSCGKRQRRDAGDRTYPVGNRGVTGL